MRLFYFFIVIGLYLVLKGLKFVGVFSGFIFLIYVVVLIIMVELI